MLWDLFHIRRQLVDLAGAHRVSVLDVLARWVVELLQLVTVKCDARSDAARRRDLAASQRLAASQHSV
eukprot:gene30547-14743_t